MTDPNSGNTPAPDDRKIAGPHFALGRVVATPGALGALAAHDVSAHTLIERHARGDWGLISAEDTKANDAALRLGGRLLSSYEVAADTRIWLITEADRSATTLLLPSEY